MLKRAIRDGLSMVWRHQRLVWWIFFVNLVLGFLAALGPRLNIHSLLDRSFYSEALSARFVPTVFAELLARPEVSPAPWLAGSMTVGLIFLIYMVFISGGVLSTYREDRKLTRGQFFESCGDFFWRMVRLLFCSILPFGIVFALLSRVNSISGKMASDAPREMQGFWVQVAGTFLCLLLALLVRAWFDLAQARIVVDYLPGMFVLSYRSFLLALRNLPRLLFIYLVTTLVAATAIVAAWALWLKIPHAAFMASWLLLELLTLLLVGIRLWQRAAMLIWYENYAQLHAPPVPLPSFVPPVSKPSEAAASGDVPPFLDEGGDPVT